LIISGTPNTLMTEAHLFLGWVQTLKEIVHPNIASKSSGKHFGSSSSTYFTNENKT